MAEARYTKGKLALDIAMALVSLIVLVPLLVVFFGAFKSSAEAIRFNMMPPLEWHPENFSIVFAKAKLGLAFWNSTQITVVVVGVTTILCALSGFIIARRNDRLSAFLNTYFSLGLIVPMAVVPTILVLQFFNIMNTKTGLMLVMIASNISWGMFILTNFIYTIPREMDEAALIDGCGPIRLFFTIILPMLKPVVLTNVVIVAMGTWNDLQTPLYLLNSSKNLTMPLTVYNFKGRYFSDWNLIFADLVLVALPMIALYVFCQKYIVAGASAGAVKG